METYAFGTFVRNYVVYFFVDGRIILEGIYRGAVTQRIFVSHCRAISHAPFHTRFINSVIGTFRLTGPAVDTFVSDIYSHGYFSFSGTGANPILFIPLFLSVAKISIFREIKNIVSFICALYGMRTTNFGESLENLD